MEKEFNLSDREINWGKWDNKLRENYYKPKDVKEFIKRLIADEYINSNGEASIRIRKLAGDKLKREKK